MISVYYSFVASLLFGLLRFFLLFSLEQDKNKGKRIEIMDASFPGAGVSASLARPGYHLQSACRPCNGQKGRRGVW
jgi:hypothetical protein